VAAAKTGKIINIKKGQFCAPSVSCISIWQSYQNLNVVRLLNIIRCVLFGTFAKLNFSHKFIFNLLFLTPRKV
jgi:3-deoxy-D-manno-octulosonic acid (KDO) 8-phosphate synthase